MRGCKSKNECVYEMTKDKVKGREKKRGGWRGLERKGKKGIKIQK